MKLEIYKVRVKGETVFWGAWEDATFCWKGQLELLEMKAHPNKELQRLFNLGLDFEMSVIKKVEEKDLQKEMFKLMSEKEEKPEPEIEKEVESEEPEIKPKRKYNKK